jgi:hypothetical protein
MKRPPKPEPVQRRPTTPRRFYFLEVAVPRGLYIRHIPWPPCQMRHGAAEEGPAFTPTDQKMPATFGGVLHTRSISVAEAAGLFFNHSCSKSEGVYQIDDKYFLFASALSDTHCLNLIPSSRVKVCACILLTVPDLRRRRTSRMKDYDETKLEISAGRPAAVC